MAPSPDFLANLAMVLCVAGATTLVSRKLRQPVVFGYLAAGMIVGPHIPIPLVADAAVVRDLSDLGVTLLMFSLGLEFRLRKLARAAPVSGVVAVIECSAMVWLGYEAGRLMGFTPVESVYAGAIVAISSTTIILKAFQEEGVRGAVPELVYGILIVEDLIAILLMAVLTTLSGGASPTAAGLAEAAGRLAAFVAALLVAGGLVVPRLMRAVARLDRDETTLVASVGLCFAFALLAHELGYSVALGAFVAGSLVAESGVDRAVKRLVEPVRDLFAAVFFVSVGMMIDPGLVARHWKVALAFSLLVVAGKFLGVTAGALLAGRSVRTSVASAMSMAQIGEFSFILAGIGLSSGSVREFLYPVAVAVSAATTLSTPWLIRGSGRAATAIDRALPRAARSFLSLYAAWVEQLRARPLEGGALQAVRRRGRRVAADAGAAVAIVAAALLLSRRAGEVVAPAAGLSAESARALLLGVAALLATPFVAGAVRGVRYYVRATVAQAIPEAGAGKVDLGAAPRRALVVTLQLGLVLLVGLPVLAAVQPFLEPLEGAAILAAALLLLGLAFWRSAANLEGHLKAVTQVLVEWMSSSAPAAGEGAGPEEFEKLHEILPGLGSVATVRVAEGDPAAGRTLGELNLGSLTGATVLVVSRGEESLVPSGKDRVLPGDRLALAGTPESVEAARRILLEPGRTDGGGEAEGVPPGTVGRRK